MKFITAFGVSVFVHHVQSASFISPLFIVCAWNMPVKYETEDPLTLVETGYSLKVMEGVAACVLNLDAG